MFNIKEKFRELVQYTYPHGTEYRLLPLLPSLEKDLYGNYYRRIGNSDTMFTSHLDTASKNMKKINLREFKKDGREYMTSDGKSILGADDKAGVAIMVHMMEQGISGLYYFFIGEEVGAVGSTRLSRGFDTTPHMKGIQRCISFDRRGNTSVITEQVTGVCCSDEFASALCGQLNSTGLSFRPDNTGIFTDSAMFVSNIRECTNISVGYMYEHTGREYQDITFLEELASAVLDVNWDSLPIVRVLTNNEYDLEEFWDV
jgi:hypothetical protein